jgi:hypothetical protein
MKHERGIVGLWGGKIPLYWSVMAKTLYNIRLVGDRPFNGAAFDALMDGFAASMDVYPSCSLPLKRRSAEKIWADFVKVAEDTNRATSNAVRSLPAQTQVLDPKRPNDQPRRLSRVVNAP